MVALLCEKIAQCTRMEVSYKHEDHANLHHVNWNSIIYRKGEAHSTEKEWLLLAAKGFNTNLVQFLLRYHVIISNVHVCSFKCTISHVQGCATKMALCAQNLMYKEL